MQRPPAWLATLRIGILLTAWLSFVPISASAATAAPLRYATSWVGNTGGGAETGSTRHWVQNSIDAIHVMADGRLFAVTRWDEASAEISIYRDGIVQGHAGSTHGWGNSGGEAITANDKYLFAAMQIDNEGGTLSDSASNATATVGSSGHGAADNARNWPPRAHLWFGITRRKVDDPSQGVPFPGGVGNRGNPAAQSFLIVNDIANDTVASAPTEQRERDQDGAIRGLAANAQFVFISNTLRNRIEVYDAETMQLDHRFDVDRPGKLALDPDGSIWVIGGFGDPARARLLHYTASGKTLPTPALTASPAATAINRTSVPVSGARVVPIDVTLAPNGDMLVADGGAAQQVLFLARTGTGYRLSHAFGARGGVFAGPPHAAGSAGGARFDGLVGIGTDAAGNLYVATNGYGPRPFGGRRGTFGSTIESYAPDGTRRWQLLGLLFADGLDVDPADPDTVYSGSKRFRIHDDRPTGQDWTYIATTSNRGAFPEDAQFNLDAGWRGQPMIRRLDGRRFLFLTDMYSSYLKIYRFDAAKEGEAAIPSGFFARTHLPGPWPPHQPRRGEWIWRDANGNGRFDGNEFTAPTAEHTEQRDGPDLWGWWVDDSGDVWQATLHDGVRQFIYGGLDASGNPIYRFSTMRSWPTPEPFTQLQRVRYDAKHDVMYLSGYTKQAPYNGQYWKEAGRTLARYDGWQHGRRTLRYAIDLPWRIDTATKNVTMAFAQTGDYLFAVETFTAIVHVYDAATGAAVGEIAPGPEIGKKSGWVDVPAGINAWRRPDGSYRIAVEDDLYGKVVLYKWNGL